MSTQINRINIPIIDTGPRKNLPKELSKKRTESNFLLSFARSFIESTTLPIIAGRELTMNGYGIADLVCLIGFVPKNGNSNCDVLSDSKHSMFAFESKMKDWRRALSQAFRYKYFANTAIVLLPPDDANRAIDFLNTFEMLKVGLWSYHKNDNVIKKIYSPPQHTPLNPNANNKAIQLLTRSPKFQQTF